MFSFYHLEVTISDPRRATLESSIYRISFFTNFTKHFHQKPVFSGQLTDEERRRPVVDDPSVISHFTTFLLVVVQCLCVCVCVCVCVLLLLLLLLLLRFSSNCRHWQRQSFRNSAPARKQQLKRNYPSQRVASECVCVCGYVCVGFLLRFFLLVSTVFSDGFTGILMGFIIHHRSGVGI